MLDPVLECLGLVELAVVHQIFQCLRFGVVQGDIAEVNLVALARLIVPADGGRIRRLILRGKAFVPGRHPAGRRKAELRTEPAVVVRVVGPVTFAVPDFPVVNIPEVRVVRERSAVGGTGPVRGFGVLCGQHRRQYLVVQMLTQQPCRFHILPVIGKHRVVFVVPAPEREARVVADAPDRSGRFDSRRFGVLAGVRVVSTGVGKVLPDENA